jgi:hypothetical protein
LSESEPITEQAETPVMSFAEFIIGPATRPDPVAQPIHHFIEL